MVPKKIKRWDVETVGEVVDAIKIKPKGQLIVTIRPDEFYRAIVRAAGSSYMSADCLVYKKNNREVRQSFCLRGIFAASEKMFYFLLLRPWRGIKFYCFGDGRRYRVSVDWLGSKEDVDAIKKSIKETFEI